MSFRVQNFIAEFESAKLQRFRVQSFSAEFYGAEFWCRVLEQSFRVQRFRVLSFSAEFRVHSFRVQSVIAEGW